MTAPHEYSDEQVEAALDAWWTDGALVHWRDESEHIRQNYRNEMRRALTAASVPAQPNELVAARAVIHDIANALGYVDWADDGRFIQIADDELADKAAELRRRVDTAFDEGMSAARALGQQLEIPAGTWSDRDYGAAADALELCPNDLTVEDRARVVLEAVQYRLAPTPAAGPVMAGGGDE